MPFYYKEIMHCDDKRTLFVLKQGIEETWEELRKNDFSDEDLIKNTLKEKLDINKDKIKDKLKKLIK